MTSPTTLPSIGDRFARFLEESDLSPITVKNYRADLRAFEKWFCETGEPDFDPAKITPTELPASSDTSSWKSAGCAQTPSTDTLPPFEASSVGRQTRA